MTNDTARIGVKEGMKSSGWTRLKATNVWQAAFVRPFEDKANWKKHMAVLLSYSFGLLFVVSPMTMLIDDALSWPVPLEQMQQTSGVLTDVVIQRRATSYFVISTSEGGEQRFFKPALHKSDLRGLVNQRVTVWSQTGFVLFYGQIQEPREIRLLGSNRNIFRYTENISHSIEFDKKDHYWFQVMLAFGLFLIARPVWKHRSLIVKTQQSTERGE